jgi:hypothetical protein
MESISVRKRDAAHGQACRSQAFGLETYGSHWTQFFKGVLLGTLAMWLLLR